jgi:hypothetical protein
VTPLFPDVGTHQSSAAVPAAVRRASAPAACQTDRSYFFVHWSTQSFTVLYQSWEFCGFSTQWPSSGK